MKKGAVFLPVRRGLGLRAAGVVAVLAIWELLCGTPGRPATWIFFAASKELEQQDVAVGIVEDPALATFGTARPPGVAGFAAARVRDVYARRDYPGTFAKNFTVAVPPMDAVLLKVTPLP